MFSKLINNREDKLYRIAYSYLKNRDDALDALQETLLKGLKNFDSLKNKEYFDTWIIRILINTCKDKLKKPLELPFEENLSLENREIDHEEIIDLLKNIDSLSSNEKEAIYLKYFEDLKIKDMAKKLDTKESTIKSRLRRALINLKASYKQGGKNEY